jgi:hypothetical protein
MNKMNCKNWQAKNITKQGHKVLSIKTEADLPHSISVVVNDTIQFVPRILVLVNKMIIFESLLTIFEANFIFYGHWSNCENWLELRIKPLLANVDCLNR